MLSCLEHNKCTNKKVSFQYPTVSFLPCFFHWKTWIFQTGSNQYSLVIFIFLSQHYAQEGCSVSTFISYCLQAKTQMSLQCAALLIRDITVNLLQQKRQRTWKHCRKGWFQKKLFYTASNRCRCYDYVWRVKREALDFSCTKPFFL